MAQRLASGLLLVSRMDTRGAMEAGLDYYKESVAENDRMTKMHPRHQIVSKAKSKITEAILDILKEYDLTYGELMSILANEIRSWAGYMIRDERGDSE